MKFDQITCKNLRDIFSNSVTKVFGDSMTFLDFLENTSYSTTKYDCYLDYSGENYIINRETGEYINWYKLDHIGRCINISTSSPYKNISKWIEDFLVKFKESEELLWECEHCGKKIPYMAIFCNECANKLLGEPPKPFFKPQESEDKCKNCEYYINPDYTRCHECKKESEDNG